MCRHFAAYLPSGNLIHREFLFPATTHYCAVPLISPTTHNWLLILPVPIPATCSTVQLITVAKCQVTCQSVCTADDWKQPCKWSWSGLYLIACDHLVFPAIWSRYFADQGKLYTDCYKSSAIGLSIVSITVVRFNECISSTYNYNLNFLYFNCSLSQLNSIVKDSHRLIWNCDFPEWPTRDVSNHLH